MPADPNAKPRSWSDLAAVAFLVIFVAAVYGARLGFQPLVGEETRWAMSARTMIATGDWIVPRQQGRVFPERPPMTIWAMAVCGLVRGDVDAIAIRLPSVIAVVLTSLLIYGYTRALASQFAALVAALAYATFGQVLQLGRMGESEAMFALAVSASLFVWHLGYSRHWPALAVWSLGFACSALAALVKGPQAPVYFVAITAVYLIARRDWRYLVRWQFAAGAALFLAILAAWQIPFYLATDWQSVAATWAGLAADRLYLSGLVEHFFTFPLETMACLLPWSPILVALAKKETRALLADQGPLVSFLAIAILVAYPTVWIAAGARSRYFMPLYPVIAVLVGLVIERCSAAVIGTYPRRAWHQFLILWGSITGASAIALCVSGFFLGRFSASLGQPRGMSLAVGALAAVTAYLLWNGFRAPRRFSRAAILAVFAIFAGASHVGLLMNVITASWIEPTSVIVNLQQEMPPGTTLVSLSPIDHRFEYYYGADIAELDWPRTIQELPAGVDYFCFMRTPGDTAEKRDARRGRALAWTPGTLPFAWEEIATICVERRLRKRPQMMVVLGRVTRPLQETVTDVTVPLRSTAQQSGPTRVK
jgi:4-amino-4-deoxy-L-arabinose transferase-like glycosyltransferase